MSELTIEQLESIVSNEAESEDEKEADEDQEEEQKKKRKPKKAKVKLLKNIKYNAGRYKIGEEVEINPKDVESFIKSEIIEGD